jgi:hypothetical protein
MNRSDSNQQIRSRGTWRSRDGTVFVDIDMEPDLRHIDVNDLLVAGDGRLWVAHDNRVGGL